MTINTGYIYNISLLNDITLCIFSYDFLFDLYWGQRGLRDQFWFFVKFRHVGVRLTFDVDQKLYVVMICEKMEHLCSLRCNIYGVQNITIMKFKIYFSYQIWFFVNFRHVGVKFTFEIDQKLNVVMICEKIEHLWSLRCKIYWVQNITIMKIQVQIE